MSIATIPSAWITANGKAAIADRDRRIYIDPQQQEYPDIGSGVPTFTVNREDNLMDRGNCESLVSPMMASEWNPVKSNLSWARSDEQAHGGKYSFKCIKSNAAGGSTPFVLLSNNNTTDLKGTIPGQTYEFAYWVYIPTASGILGSEVVTRLRFWDVGGARTDVWAPAAEIFDRWQRVTATITLDTDATGFTILVTPSSLAEQNEYFYADDFRLSAHVYPGSHRLTGGYSEHLTTLPDTGTIQIEFVPQFAFNTGNNESLCEWRIDATHWLRIFYAAGIDSYVVGWSAGNNRTLQSAPYDDGSTQRNIAQRTVLTVAFDLTTESTAGSSLWMDKIQDDTAWSGKIDFRTSTFNILQLRRSASLSNTGAYAVLSVRYFPNIIATDADVQNDFKDIEAEEIYWSCDGHMTGKTRCNVSAFSTEVAFDEGILDRVSHGHAANRFDFTLQNRQGEFSDDQYAAFVPASNQYNGTVAQKFLQSRMPILVEDWYAGDHDSAFAGRLTYDKLLRKSTSKKSSIVKGKASDMATDLNLSFEREGRFWEDYALVRGDNLMDRGNCESIIWPMIFREGDPGPVTTNCNWQRSTDTRIQGKGIGGGSHAFEFKKAIAAGTAADVYFHDDLLDTNLHGLKAGKEYTFEIWIYLEAGAILGSEVIFFIWDFQAGWASTSTTAVNVYDKYQLITVTRTLRSAATGIQLQMSVAAAASINESIWVDNVHLIPTDHTEAHDQSLFHLKAHRADRRFVQFAADNSFEGTITNSYAAGGIFTQEADPLFGSNCGQLVNITGSEQPCLQITLFTGTKKINVGETYNYSIYLKSAAAAAAIISITEGDDSAPYDSTQESYSLLGGEDWVKFEVSHTITDSDSDRLRTLINVANGETVKMDGWMIIQNDRSLNYFEANSNEGVGAYAIADDAVELVWPWFGFNTDNVNYFHPWARMNIGETVWDNLKSIAGATGPRYLGADKNGTLTYFSALREWGDDPVITDSFDENDIRPKLESKLTRRKANKWIGHGDDITKHTALSMVWQGTATGHFTEDADNALAVEVLDDGYFPDPVAYPEYWARYSNDSQVINVLDNSAFGRGPYVGEERQYVEWYPVTQSVKGGAVPGVLNKDGKIIGIRNAELREVSTAGKNQMTKQDLGEGATGMDTTSRAGQVHMLLRNETGDTITVRDVGIFGAPVLLQTGDQGHIHDSYVNYEDIGRNGERLLAIGNHDVVDNPGQLNALMDYAWKITKTDRHEYVILFIGTLYQFTSGARYLAAIGGAGETEFIDSVVEVANVRISQRTGSFGETRITFREIHENWKPDSNAFARFVASGRTRLNLSTQGEIWIGAEDFIGQCDYNISDGDTSQETIINQAIDFIAEYGGGKVRLTQGLYKIDGPIILKSNIILQGAGPQTIIEKNGDFDAITATGGSGTELTGIELRDFALTRNAADTNASKVLINWDFVDASKVANIVVDDSYDEGIDLDNCGDIAITNCILTDNGNASTDATININTCTEIRISNCNFLNGAGSAILSLSTEVAISSCTFSTFGNIIIFLSTGSDYSAITGCIIKNTSVGAGIRSDVNYASIIGNTINGCDDDGIRLRTCQHCTISANTIEGNGEIGIELETVVDDCTIADNICQNNGTGGIKISAANCDRNIIDDNVCADNGADTGIDNSNNDNFDDQGTNTFVG